MDSVGCGPPAILLAEIVKFRIFWYTLGLVGALLVGAFLVWVLERWRKRSGTEGLSAGDQLSHFRELRDQGTITQEEYERIRARLAGTIRREMNVPPPVLPAVPPAAPVSPQQGTITQEEYERSRAHPAGEANGTPPTPGSSQDVMTFREKPPPDGPVSQQ
jgi:hypothetical protein